MPQPTLDAGVEHLESFCNLLGQTSAVLARDAEVLELREGTLERTETATQEKAEHVEDRLATALDDLTEAHAAAVEEADRLTELARELSVERLSASGESLESSESSFEERISQDRAELEKHFVDLSEAG